MAAWYVLTNRARRWGGGSSCTELAGGSPVAGSAGAPRSRPRATRETSASEWGVKSPRGAIRFHGGEQVRRPSDERTLQPRDINNRKGEWPSRSCHGEGNRLHLPEFPEGCRTLAGYGGGHADTARCGTGETRPGGPRWALAVPISRRRKGIVSGGSPRGS